MCCDQDLVDLPGELYDYSPFDPLEISTFWIVSGRLPLEIDYSEVDQFLAQGQKVWMLDAFDAFEASGMIADGALPLPIAA